MKEKLKNFINRWIFCKHKCPECGTWMENIGIDMLRIWQDEYYCPKCKKYFYI